MKEFNLYPLQAVAKEVIIKMLDQGSKFVILDAPPGAGKTVIGKAIADELGRVGSQAIYTCHSKALQRQFTDDFPQIPAMYGRGNYQTQLDPTKTTDECLGVGCKFCKECPYKVAKADFINSAVGMTNISYLLAETNFVGTVKPDVLIIDEADTLEAALLDFAELSISERHLRLMYGIMPPERKTIEASWLEWAQRSLPVLLDKLRQLRQKEKNNNSKELQDKIKHAEGLIRKFKLLCDDELGIKSGNWVYDGYKEETSFIKRAGASPTNQVKFRPIRVGILAEGLIWRFAKKVVLMSGTVVNAAVMAETLGIPDFETVSLPSRFPAQNRPIYIRPVAKMNAKSTPEDFDNLAKEITKIMSQNSGRILIHTVSYRYAAELAARIRNERIVTYSTSNEVESAVKQYLQRKNAVLIASSLARGISLSYDQCDVVIIVKVPYLSLGDKQVSARLYSPGGQMWYTVSAIREIIQMTGRGMRAHDDYCATYILDSAFNDLFKHKKHFPQWWKDAIRKESDGRI